ncbi:hypothetical protein O181_120670, partial [Austropuccinia psidii MF-1]|nr:hypothetical protein [Austropuccinia psidii MF-1]
MKILKKCGGELAHALRNRCIELCSTEEYINAVEDIVTRRKLAKLGKNWKSNVQISHLSKKINQKKLSSAIHPKLMSKENAINVEEESHSEKETEQSECSESDEINIINANINNIDIIYEVLDVNSNLPQVGTSDKNLTNVQDAKLYRTKPAKGMGYKAGKSSISIVMVNNEEAKVNLDKGAYCKCVGKICLKTIVPDWQERLIPIQGVKFSSASESKMPLGIIDLTLIFPHPSQCVRIKVEFVVMDNCTS